MKVAVSDYDGTIRMHSRVEAAVIRAIEQWRAKGNVFGIASGRDLSMLDHEVKQFGIPFDFLICANGSIIYDHNYEVLHSVNIDDSLVPLVLRHQAALASMHYELCRNAVVYLYMRDARSWFPRLGVPFEEISLDESFHITGLQQLSLAYMTSREGNEYAQMLNAAFGDNLHAHQNGACIDITLKGINKATGILQLLKIKKWSQAKVVVIGDGHNDLDMIKRFQGFTVRGAMDDIIKKEALAIYDNVADMLRAHL